MIPMSRLLPRRSSRTKISEIKMAKKKTKATKKVRERKNLTINNCGDTVLIRNRSAIAAGLFGAIVIFLCVAAVISLKAAWSLPLFWTVIAVFMAASVYAFVNMIFGKIVLDSPNKQMIVYNPFKKTYKFEDVNYVDVKTSKDKEGVVSYTVVAYIGNGRKSVQVTSFSGKQADELCSLLRGMLDNGAMEYPEGNEEPFHFDDEEEKRSKAKKRKKTEEPEPVFIRPEPKAVTKVENASPDENKKEEV